MRVSGLGADLLVKAQVGTPIGQTVEAIREFLRKAWGKATILDEREGEVVLRMRGSSSESFLEPRPPVEHVVQTVPPVERERCVLVGSRAFPHAVSGCVAQSFGIVC